MAKKFTFKQDGKTYSIPAFSDLPMGVVRKARKATDEADTAFTIIESVMGEDSPELNAVDSMNAEQFQAFITGWTQGAGAGEALSSAN
jgi:hypothetical protein